MKKIVLTRSSNIFDDSRATKEIQTLLKMNYEIVVIGWNRSGNASEQCKLIFGDKIKFVFYNGDVGKSKFDKIISRYKWNTWLSKQLEAEEKISCIHACDFDTGNVVRQFALHHNINYIYDIYDYYTDAHPVPFVLKKYIERKEISVINDSEICIICTEERIEQISGAKPKDIMVVHNSPEVEGRKDVEMNYDYIYCGSLYNGRLISEILEAYKEHQDFRFVFAGYGDYAELGKKLSQKYDHFTFFDSIPYAKVLELENQAKIISAIYNPIIRNHRLCAPNKFYEALALGKPVIVCRGTGIDKIVEKYEIGCVIDYKVEDFYEAVQFLIDNPQIALEMGARGRNLYNNQYAWHLMEEKLIHAYQRLVGKEE